MINKDAIIEEIRKEIERKREVACPIIVLPLMTGEEIIMALQEKNAIEPSENGN